MNFMNRNRTYSVNTPFNNYIVYKSNNSNNNNNKISIGTSGNYSRFYTGSKDFLRKINSSSNNVTRHVSRIQTINTLSAIAGIFVFITVVTTAIIALFCCKRNTVYAFPKSDPEDYDDFELEDIQNKVATDTVESANRSDQSFCEQFSSDEDSIASTEPIAEDTTTEGFVAGGGESQSQMTVYQSNSSWMHSQASLVPRAHLNNKLSSSSFQCGFVEMFTHSHRKDCNSSEEEDTRDDNRQRINHESKVMSPIRFIRKNKPRIHRYRSMTSDGLHSNGCELPSNGCNGCTDLGCCNNGITSDLRNVNGGMASGLRYNDGSMMLRLENINRSKKALLCRSQSSSVQSFNDISLQEMRIDFVKHSEFRETTENVKLQRSVSSEDLLQQNGNKNDKNLEVSIAYDRFLVAGDGWKHKNSSLSVIKSRFKDTFGVEGSIDESAFQSIEESNVEMSDFISVLQPLI